LEGTAVLSLPFAAAVRANRADDKFPDLLLKFLATAIFHMQDRFQRNTIL